MAEHDGIRVDHRRAACGRGGCGGVRLGALVAPPPCRRHGRLRRELARHPVPRGSGPARSRAAPWVGESAGLEALARRKTFTSKARLVTVLELIATSLQHERFQAAATAVVTELANTLGCERASICFIKGQHIVLRALLVQKHGADAVCTIPLTARD